MSRRHHALRPTAEAIFGFCQFVEDGPDLFVAGMVSVDAGLNVLDAGDMPAQVKRVYTDIVAHLARLGFEPADICEELIYVTDMAAFVAANELRKSVLTPACRPATTAVQVAALVFPGLVIEVACRARRGGVRT